MTLPFSLDTARAEPAGTMSKYCKKADSAQGCAKNAVLGMCFLCMVYIQQAQRESSNMDTNSYTATASTLIGSKLT
jgi:hypothetical protein